MELANTLAYYDTATIMALKRFIVQATDIVSHVVIKQSSLCLLSMKYYYPKGWLITSPQILG
jgi:hypothetical protein